uniref:Uncharacterized protein n=1 Tax=Avena sativa TaxID=4498 RepID=A0ACD5WRR8_AVESA
MSHLGMEGRCTSQAIDDDRLSSLTDDIILSILMRVDITTATRTSVLSKRWRNFPWLLSELKLVSDFLPTPFPEPFEAHHVEKAMSCLTKATRSFLADPRRKSTNITWLLLRLYLNSNYSREIGPLVRDAIDSGLLKELGLGFFHEKKEPRQCPHKEMVQQAWDVIEFFTTYPCVHSCLVRLFVHNARFAEQDIHHLLFDSCKELKQLILFHCDVGDCSVWQINAPDSKLKLLQVTMTLLRVEVLCLPKLERLHLDHWFYCEPPLRFGFVPSLNELTLICNGTLKNREFSLSAVLRGTTNIHTLTLDFDGGGLWIQPEGKQLCPAFSKLRKLSICGMFVDFDLIWTINLLEAAPSVEIFLVQIWDHPCREEMRLRAEAAYGNQRTKPSWSINGFTSSNTWQLKELLFIGYRPLEQQTLFIRAAMKRAPNLKAVHLKENEKPCRRCEAMSTPCPPPRGGFFPRVQEEQDTIVKQLREGVSSSARIIFSSSHATVKCAVYS